MSDNLADNIAENLSRPAQWVRIAYMVALAVAAYIASIVVVVVVIAQALFSLVAGSDNANLREFGSSLSIYVKQILDFLTYNSEEKPFPFAPFPEPQVNRYPRTADRDDIDADIEIEVNDPRHRDN